MREASIYKEVFFILAFSLILFLGISLFSYSPIDPTFNSSGVLGYKIYNKGGLVGAYLAGLIFDLFGIVGFLILPYLALCVLSLFAKVSLKKEQWFALIFGFVLLLVWAEFPFLKKYSFHQVCGGGWLGKVLQKWLFLYLSKWGTFIFLSGSSLICLQLLFKFSWKKIFFPPYSQKDDLKDRQEQTKQNVQESNFKNSSKTTDVFAEENESLEENEKKTKNFNINKDFNINKENSKRESKKAPSLVFPPVSFLNSPGSKKDTISNNYLKKLSVGIEECLANFGIKGGIESITPGPVVTMVEFKPDPGIKISKIANLSDDLALNLKASKVRIIAPLPGRDTIGIEVPNPKREIVYLRDIIESKVFTQRKMDLPLSLGKDIQGKPVVVDLTTLPHLLVAGATGTGKSVCLNAFLVSLLYGLPPQDLQLLLIDPKRIELSIYDGLPHLVHPVITETDLAKVGLEWAISEMERRYELMAQTGVRNIKGYNQKIKSDSDGDLLPYLVIIIDELADLMLTGSKEVEVSIVRLAQLARAAGIHLILATQRPSVDVVTGIIKANFPARIAFQVSSKHDSRTILDSNGAEYLLGKGDMLFKASGGLLQRVHGAYVSEEEIIKVVEFWKEQNLGSNYFVDLKEFSQQKQTEQANNSSAGEISDDPKYHEAVEYAIQTGKVSISMLQRRLRIGFNKAALLVEQMEKDGIIGPQQGSKPREVLIKK